MNVPEGAGIAKIDVQSVTDTLYCHYSTEATMSSFTETNVTCSNETLLTTTKQVGSLPIGHHLPVSALDQTC